LPHPMGADHLRAPTATSPASDDLPLSTTGEVVCTTCHEPHASKQGIPKRLRAQGKELCKKCHLRFF
jgi:predicted CXXCH cytochrome family protein